MAPKLKEGRDAAEKPRAVDVLAQQEEDDSARHFLKARALIESLKAQDVRIKLLRRDPKTGKWAYLASLDADVFDEDFVQREYGPGSFKFSCYGAKSSENPSGYLGGGSFDIAVPLVAATPAPTPPASDGFGVKEMLALVMQQNTALIAALAGRGGGGGDAAEIVAAAKQITEMVKPASFDPMSVFKDALTLGMKMGRRGDGDAKDFDQTLLEGVAAPLLEIVRQQRQPAPAGAAPAQEVHTLPRRDGTMEPPADAPGWIKTLHPYFPMLLSMAKAGTSASIVVDLIYDRAPEDVLDRIAGDCIAPNWIADTLRFMPVGFQTTYRAWTEGVLGELKDALLAPPDDDDDDSGHDDDAGATVH